MELKNDFQVDIPIQEIWAAFKDVERIAPCLPGAQLQEVEGDEFRGIVKIKVGPITTQYKGVATFLEQDEAAKKVVIKAEGRDTKGAGNASATITVQLKAEGDNQTNVVVATDLAVTGKVAQFGRGVMGDISSKLMEQFAQNLRDMLADSAHSETSTHTEISDDAETSDDTETSDDASSVKPEELETNVAETNATETDTTKAPDQPSVRKIDSEEPEAVDVLAASSSKMVRFFGGIAGFFLAIFLGIKKIFRRKPKAGVND